MKKMIWGTVMIVLFVVFIVPGILAGLLRVIPGNDQPDYNPDVRISIYRDRYITQNFVSKVNNLTAIGTSIRNPNLNNKTDIDFNLYDENGSLIRSIVLNGQNIEDGAFIRISFPVIPDSLGKKYTFSLSSPAAGPESTIEVFIIDRPDPLSGITDYTYEDEIHTGGMPIVAYSQVQNKFGVVKSVYSNWFSRLLPLR